MKENQTNANGEGGQEEEYQHPQWAAALLMMGLVSLIGCPINPFTAHKYTRSNIVESHTPLEPDTCAATEGISEIKTVVYGEIVKMKQDRIIPVFHCPVFETIVSQYCGHWSSASDKSV
jgi:hypothetical protein